MLKIFHQKKWFTEAYLNHAILQFSYDPISRKSKCIPINKHSDKVSENASQIWCFIRFFPLLVHDKVKSHCDDVWQMVLLLCLIV